MDIEGIYQMDVDVIYGNFGDEKEVVVGLFRVGQLMILPDGRRYRRAMIPRSEKWM